MPKWRKVKIKGLHHTTLNERALTKLIRYYYKGPHDLTIMFNPKTRDYGEHSFDESNKVHQITISTIPCSYGRKNIKFDYTKLTLTSTLDRLNEHDTRCRLIHTLLHELTHANQYARDPKLYWKLVDEEHSSIKQPILKYELSPLEAEAEGTALRQFQEALKKYNDWCEE